MDNRSGTIDQADIDDGTLARRIAIAAPLAHKVAGVHGDKAPRMREVPDALEALADGADPKAFVARVSALTDGFATPPWACTTYRRLIDELRAIAEAVAPGAVR